MALATVTELSASSNRIGIFVHKQVGNRLRKTEEHYRNIYPLPAHSLGLIGPTYVGRHFRMGSGKGKYFVCVWHDVLQATSARDPSTVDPSVYGVQIGQEAVVKAAVSKVKWA